ncbi:MAG: hypothetical protein RR326_10200 [Stenotrophomonas sp.]
MLQRYKIGIALSVLLAACIFIVGVLIVTDNRMAILAILYAPLLAVVLIPTLAVTWIVYLVRDRGKMPATAHIAISGPLIVALLALLLTALVCDHHNGRLFKSYPAVSEVHVNLTGQSLWLDDSIASGFGGGGRSAHPMPVPATPIAMTTEITRWPPEHRPDESPFPYRGYDLKSSQRTFGRALGDGKPQAQVIPLLSSKASALPQDLPFRYFYYHYLDHVDAVPVLSRSIDLELSRARQMPAGLTLISVANFGTTPIIRIEINGQAVDLQKWGNATIAASTGCPALRTPQSPVMLVAGETLNLRWQQMDAPDVWHQAQLADSPLHVQKKFRGSARLPQLMLYFADQRTPEAQRFQEIALSTTKTGLVAAAAPEKLASVSACASVLSGFDLRQVTLL